jgi:hypothetical protein
MKKILTYQNPNLKLVQSRIMAMVFLLVGGLAILLYEYGRYEPRRLSGQVPLKERKADPWSKIVQKGQVIVSEPFTSIGGYAIACDGRDFMYSPDVDEVHPSQLQMENPQEIPIGI